ncbi:MAG: LuxR family transcriptional regulator, partial [Chloroflexota bacterium]|nr:LuxR family transcriptional regulator [Chloroflexota bacterium]
PEERVLFRRLAVFVGGATLDAIAAVASAPGHLAIDIFDGVASLVANSLLRQVEDAGGEPRYVLLETIREYGLERLVESGEEEAIRRTHADYLLTFAESEKMGAVGGTMAGPRCVRLSDGR